MAVECRQIPAAASEEQKMPGERAALRRLWEEPQSSRRQA